MSQPEAVRTLFIGGPNDGEWLEADEGRRQLFVPAKPGEVVLPTATNLPDLMPAPALYERCTLYLEGGAPVSFFRLSTMTNRQALLWMMTGYRKGGQES